ncbi:hypothetical protein [Falsiroseomonas selenitidurans]|uniref:Uncharacterized protein n=1 Tax=Falsiroseomonas selenitidurans TaxID=2716335 RepID=A0ABX1DZS5_9PROT|nr:hypothetical protein [Falsiroseomonas selenitidurans]NKC30404.1 hypothetical protein [Falsiroseomonas selenitidurans]
MTLACTGWLLLPCLIFAVGFFAWPWALAVLALGGAGFALLPRGPWPLGARGTLACLAGGLAWAFGSSGTHHLLYAVVDWQIRDAVLLDLATGPWPVGYSVGEAGWLLRAPLGYYMPAALVGRLAGPAAAEAALYLWTGLGLALVLALLRALGRAVAPGRWPVLPVLVFLGFGGLDLLPNIWLDVTEGAGLASYWARGGEWWARLFQYSGHATLLLWVPNHALPGWIPALLLLRHARRPAFLGSVALPLAAAAWWAPLSALGAGLLAAAAVLAGGWRMVGAAARGGANWLGLALAVPEGLFLSAGAGTIPHGPLFAEHGLAALPRLLLFLLVEFGAVAAAALLLVRSRLLLASLGLLALLPLYVFGPGNEMTMRTGIAPLAVLAVAAGFGLQQATPGWRRRLLAGLLLVAGLGQAMEASLLTLKPWAASRDCALPEAAAQSVFDATDWSHYVVPWPDADLQALLADPVLRPVDPDRLARCWPDQAGTVPGSATSGAASSAGP